MEGSVSHYNATQTFSFYFVGATDCNSPAFHQVNRVMGRPQLKPSEFQAFALTCVEDHEIIGGSSLQQASVHMDVVSHSHRAVSECSEGHAADCTAVPGQRHCWQSRESMSAGQGWRPESCTERKEERNKACGRCPYPFSSSFSSTSSPMSKLWTPGRHSVASGQDDPPKRYSFPLTTLPKFAKNKKN